METDYLRCSPSFFGARRYDGVIYTATGNEDEGTAQYGFAKLIFCFTMNVKGNIMPLAFVEGMTVPRTRNDSDKELGLYRVHSKGRDKPMVIPLRSLKRGALLYEDPEKPLDYYVVDAVDQDMFVRVERIFSAWQGS